eukprot:gnl/TRDRNA2_/TRDRNA2_180404_c0_seq1.p1 gnl/TRDRNA2_/TRDRNA2_180404_c0~~gnl/TRDRNA2_/TRDRNA2_180404_c0_seq1.p1  ORF type:complete len:186 (+),score=21.35 gnl/TRDRNA2_/TRDRNA2_180404_c0_seq1:151-708(+)
MSRPFISSLLLVALAPAASGLKRLRDEAAKESQTAASAKDTNRLSLLNLFERKEASDEHAHSKDPIDLLTGQQKPYPGQVGVMLTQKVEMLLMKCVIVAIMARAVSSACGIVCLNCPCCWGWSNWLQANANGFGNDKVFGLPPWQQPPLDDRTPMHVLMHPTQAFGLPGPVGIDPGSLVPILGGA